MEFLTNSLKEVVSKLSEDQKEEIDVIESIVSTNETNKENTKEVSSYLDMWGRETVSRFPYSVRVLLRYKLI